MSQHQLSQRIKYLVEHGGIAEEPIDDLKREARWARLWGAAVLALLLLDVALSLK